MPSQGLDEPRRFADNEANPPGAGRPRVFLCPIRERRRALPPRRAGDSRAGIAEPAGEEIPKRELVVPMSAPGSRRRSQSVGDSRPPGLRVDCSDGYSLPNHLDRERQVGVVRDDDRRIHCPGEGINQEVRCDVDVGSFLLPARDADHLELPFRVEREDWTVTLAAGRERILPVPLDELSFLDKINGTRSP